MCIILTDHNDDVLLGWSRGRPTKKGGLRFQRSHAWDRPTADIPKRLSRDQPITGHHRSCQLKTDVISRNIAHF